MLITQAECIQPDWILFLAPNAYCSLYLRILSAQGINLVSIIMTILSGLGAIDQFLGITTIYGAII